MPESRCAAITALISSDVHAWPGKWSIMAVVPLINIWVAPSIAPT